MGFCWLWHEKYSGSPEAVARRCKTNPFHLLALLGGRQRQRQRRRQQQQQQRQHKRISVNARHLRININLYSFVNITKGLYKIN